MINSTRVIRRLATLAGMLVLSLTLFGALGPGIALGDPTGNPGHGKGRAKVQVMPAPALLSTESRFSLAGRVESVNYASNTIKVMGPAGKVAILVTPTTSIARHGETGGISDIRRGVRITILGIARPDGLTAQTIIIR